MILTKIENYSAYGIIFPHLSDALNFDKLIEWRSILVGTANAEDGLKNPLKSISMKFLVLA